MNDLDLARRVRRYEGLVRSTANRIIEHVELDLDDVEQRLRIKVWKALDSYVSRGAETPDAKGRTPCDRYVFMCVVNEKKDILALRRRGEIGLDVLVTSSEGLGGGSFEAQYLATSPDQVFGHIEEDDLRLPSTLTGLEKRIIVLLYVQRYQTEIAIELGLSKGEMERAMRAIRAKLADWRPSASERGSVLVPPLPRCEQQDHRQAA